MTKLKDSLFKYHHQLLDCTIFFYLFTPLSDRVERKSSLPFQFFKKTENGYFSFMIARARGKIFEVGSSPNLMSDNPKSTIFATSKLFPSFSSEVIRSPTSILESKPFSVTNHPFFSKRNCRKPHWSHKDSRGIGLGIIDALSNCKSDNRSLNSSSRMIVFGSQLKIQIPQVESSSNSSTGSVESPHSPIEFGIKNKDSQLALHSSSDLSIEGLPPSPEFFTREMELLEEYTCVISHGPNPKKTHIFDNCIMENCDDGFAMWKKENRVFSEKSSDYPSADFLSFCHACNKTLVCKDIFMYRGEIAFCSRECRQQEMISDDELRSAL